MAVAPALFSSIKLDGPEITAALGYGTVYHRGFLLET